MRAKQIMSHFNLRARAKLVWSRITLSRLTTLYFAVAAIHCIIQIGLQSHAFTVNASAASSLWGLIVQANLAKEGGGFAILSPDDLRICYHLPKDSTAECQVIWSPNNTNNAVAQVPEYAVANALNTLALSTTATPAVISTFGASVLLSSTASALPTTQAVSSSSLATSVASSKTTVRKTTSTVTVTASPSTITTAITATIVQSSTQRAASTSRTVASGATSTVALPTSSASQVNAGAGAAAVDNNEDNNDSESNSDVDDGGLADTVAALTRGKTGLKGANTGASKRELSVEAGTNGSFLVSGLHNNAPFEVSQTCIQALIYPVQTLSNTKREDITLIGFQFWVLTMSFVAILNESIPHLSAALVTQLLVAVWTAIQVTETESFRKEFFRLIVNGACRPHNLIGDYWQDRMHAEIASAVLNGVTVLVTGIMTYKLIKVYSWQTYKRIGASLTINRIYKLVLCLSMAIQLALFFVVATAGLWVDQLYHGAVAQISIHRTIYQSGVIVMACLLPPWLTLGWFAIRREWRVWSLVFLGLNLAFLAMWAVQFDSTSFRWTLILWRFFSLMVIVSGLLLLATLGLGLACRLNFGKGLPTYLNFQEPTDGVDFTPVYPDGKDPEMGDYKEKIDFPSSGGKRLSANFADQQSYADYGYGHGYNGTYGSYTGSYGSSNRTEGVRSPERVVYPTHIRTGSASTMTSSNPVNLPLTRTTTQSSHTSQNSISSTGSGPHRNGSVGKRWVIE